jgi:SAM-dependent methyltransferase
MAQQDKIKWDKKYLSTPALLEHREPSQKLIDLVQTIKKGKALDIASGTGKNSLYLAKHGFEVDAYDISNVAIDFIKEKNIQNITTHMVDLEGFVPLSNIYDLVVMTNYLDRNIIPHLLNALKQNGILYIETYMHDESNTKPNSNPKFLLEKNELKNFIDSNYTIIEYDEFNNDNKELYRMKKQSIIVKK